MWFQNNKWKILIPILILAVLAAAFVFGGRAPERTQPEALPPAETEVQRVSAVENSVLTPEPVPDAPEEAISEAEKEEAEPEDENEPGAAETREAGQSAMEIDPETGKDAYMTDPVPEGKPLPVEPQDAAVNEEVYTCTISISCAAVLDNMDLCDEDKKELIPADGWILCPTEVSFYEGESVFHVLRRVCKQNGIHMEFENTPLYNSAYIEGIYNLYEFDVGELSGWMYKVNDWFPNYGCSRYQLKDGDVICWVYTCDLGYDVGGGYAVGE